MLLALDASSVRTERRCREHRAAARPAAPPGPGAGWPRPAPTACSATRPGRPPRRGRSCWRSSPDGCGSDWRDGARTASVTWRERRPMHPTDPPLEPEHSGRAQKRPERNCGGMRIDTAAEVDVHRGRCRTRPRCSAAGTGDRMLGPKRHIAAILDRGSSWIAARHGFEPPRSGRIGQRYACRCRSMYTRRAAERCVAPLDRPLRIHAAERVPAWSFAALPPGIRVVAPRPDFRSLSPVRQYWIWSSLCGRVLPGGRIRFT